MGLTCRALLLRRSRVHRYIETCAVSMIPVLILTVGILIVRNAIGDPGGDYLGQRTRQYDSQILASQRLTVSKMKQRIWTGQQAVQHLLDQQCEIETRFIYDCRFKRAGEERYDCAVREHLMRRAHLIRRYESLKQSGQWVIHERYVGRRLRASLPARRHHRSSPSIVTVRPGRQPAPAAKVRAKDYRHATLIPAPAPVLNYSRGGRDEFEVHGQPLKSLKTASGNDIELIR